MYIGCRVLLCNLILWSFNKFMLYLKFDKIMLFRLVSIVTQNS